MSQTPALGIMSPTSELPSGLESSLEIDYQERYDNFSDFGNAETPKVSAPYVRWIFAVDSARHLECVWDSTLQPGELFWRAAKPFLNASMIPTKRA